MSTKLVFFALVLVLLAPLAAFADDDDDNDNKLKAVPFAFVGKADDCAFPPDTPTYPAGSRIVTSAWLGGMGLPDNGSPNFNATTPSDPPNKKDPHLGLLLNKNGASAICSSAGAEIKGVKGMDVTASFHLGFDYRNGGHCGAGAPRFNVVSKTGSTETFHFVGGCSNGTPMTAGQDPNEWTRVRFDTANPAQSFPPIPEGSEIRSIDLIYDEGTDTPNNDTQGVGLAVVDNIDINGREIRKGSGIEDGIHRDKDGKDRNRDRDDD